MGGSISGGDTLSTIDYITISIPSNSTDFGDLTAETEAGAGLSNGSNERAVMAGGYDIDSIVVDKMDYITISTTGNASTLGALTVALSGTAGVSDGAD